MSTSPSRELSFLLPRLTRFANVMLWRFFPSLTVHQIANLAISRVFISKRSILEQGIGQEFYVAH